MAAGEAIAAQVSMNAAAGAVPPETRFPDEWQSVLEGAGAQFEGTRVGSFGALDAERERALSGEIMADLSHFGLIAVEGPEASKFLANLFTGDVRQVSATQGQFTSWCDGKGRIVVTFWLFMRSDAFYLLLPGELLASTLTRFRQFLLRTKATIRDASSSLVRVGLSGAGLRPRLSAVLGAPAPTVRGETLAAGECTLVSLGGAPNPRWLAIGPAEGMKKLWDSLQPETTPVGSSAWLLLDILAGIPFVGSETSGEFVPQMVNLEALGGLSFTKGCYPGQEVVARLHYRGQLKRRLYLASIDGDQVPPAGAKLYASGTSESVGMVIAAAVWEPQKVALLAVVVIDQQVAGEVHLQELQGPRLVFQDLDADVAGNH